jgi:glycosyltransferase involved in cell wall biosynthesis
MPLMCIAMLAPPWIPVPAPAYGGIEEVIRLLSGGLVDRGHDVVLFAPPSSTSAADVWPVLEEPHPDEIERARWEVDHVARAFAAMDAAADEGRPFDVVHDHTGHAALAMADRLATPLVHTLHGPFDASACQFYATHGRKGSIVAISAAQRADAPPEMGDATVVYNPLAFADWQMSSDPGDHVLFMGRMAPVKGPHRAIAAARAAGVPLQLGGPVQPGQEEFFAAEVEPHIDGDAVTYAGEIGADDKQAAYGAARALLMPIRWAEPFGLVMIEAMACGTPVIAFREGSVPEIVVDGVNGFLVDDEEQMAAAIGRLDELDREAVRASAQERFDVDHAVSGYERVYERAAGARHRRFARRAGTTRTSVPPHAPHRDGAAGSPSRAPG